MRFKLDENLSRAVSRVLIDAGYDVSSVHEQRIGGTDDGTLAGICRAESRILVTLDLDFADVVAYPPDQNAGFIVIRAHIQESNHLTAIVRSLLPVLRTESPVEKLWVVDETSVRIRGGRAPD